MTYTREQIRENRKKWVEAIRSGNYVQAQGVLRTAENAFCCLGVACEIFKDHPDVQRGWTKGDYWFFDAHRDLLPDSVANLLGIDDCGSFRDNCVNNNLASANDNGYSFEEIADIIEDEEVLPIDGAE